MKLLLSIILIVSSWFTLCVSENLHEKSHLRKLIGSNCILIERGDVPPYYDCLGCLIEEAQACIDDMRYNRSYNVPGDCRLKSVKEFRKDRTCCPRFGENQFGVLDLSYIGSAYPETFRCMERVGCESSVIYSQLSDECHQVCGGEPDPRNGEPVCFAAFNAASTVRASSTLTLISLVLSIGLYLVSI